MKWIKAVILTFSTYTRIPMPRVKWDEDAMKLSLAFLPLVGVVVGAVILGWQIVCRSLEISAVLFAAVTVALPIIITGGIHMDGFCDTSDALASWQDKDRRLEILKDTNVGAFALIRYGVYLLVSFALFYELFIRGYDVGVGFIFILSRCLAAWSAMTMPNARKDGMLAAFTENADRRPAVIILTVLTIIGIACWVWFTFPYGFAGLILCVPVTFWYRSMAKKRFGGVTGDTTGFYLQIVEMALLAGLLVGGVAWEWL